MSVHIIEDGNRRSRARAEALAKAGLSGKSLIWRTKAMIDANRVKELVAKHGDLRPQAAEEWKGEFPLPQTVARFYRDIGPVDITIKGYGNPFFLPSLARLWAFQAGYRWNSLTSERIGEWDDDWLVVADEGGDPFILSRSSGRIFIATHGTGTWEPTEMFPDISIMAASLGILGNVVQEAGERLTDDDCLIRPEVRAIVVTRLSEVLDSNEAAERALASLGWE